MFVPPAAMLSANVKPNSLVTVSLSRLWKLANACSYEFPCT